MVNMQEKLSQAKEENNLDIIRYLADILLGEGKKDELAKVLADLAVEYRRKGSLKDAVCEMKRSLKVEENKINQAILEFWEDSLPEPVPKPENEEICPYCNIGMPFSSDELIICPHCQRLISVCSSCSSPNKLFELYCRTCGDKLEKPPENIPRINNLTPEWTYPLDQPERILPPPVIVGDLLVVPDTRQGSLLALKITTGEKAWELKDAFYPERPFKIYFSYPYIYIFSFGRVEIIKPDLSREVIYSDNSFIPLEFSCPVTIKTMIFFPYENCLLVLSKLEDRRCFLLQVELAEGDYFHSPVELKEEILVGSKKGKLFKLYLKNGSFFKGCGSVADGEVAGQLLARQDTLCFESFNEGRRLVNFWKSENENRVIEISDSLCSPQDEHFNYVPISYQDGLLLIDDTSPYLYYIHPERHLVPKRIHLEVGIGPVRLQQISPTLSFFQEPYFISSIPGGFFCYNLENSQEPIVEFLPGEMITRPVYFNNRLILTTEREIKCYKAE